MTKVRVLVCPLVPLLPCHTLLQFALLLVLSTQFINLCLCLIRCRPMINFKLHFVIATTSHALAIVRLIVVGVVAEPTEGVDPLVLYMT